MINPNEVEKGNYIAETLVSGYFRVKGKRSGPGTGVVFDFEEDQGWVPADYAEGISLTPEMMQKIGFKPIHVTSHSSLLAFCDDDDNPNFILHQRSEGVPIWTYKPTGREIGFVHELQNLYRLVKSQELNITL
jgi:hypothetical protein